jgi:hypothetical protein
MVTDEMEYTATSNEWCLVGLARAGLGSQNLLKKYCNPVCKVQIRIIGTDKAI